MEKELLRVWVVLQRELDSGEVVVAGVYTDKGVADEVAKNLNSMYSQDYYVQDAMLNRNLWSKNND